MFELIGFAITAAGFYWLGCNRDIWPRLPDWSRNR